VVHGVQRRACHLAVDGGALLIISTPDVPLAPNALAVDVTPHLTPSLTLAGAGFRVGQAVALGAGAPPDRDADWHVTVGAASTWEPRPRIHGVLPHDLVGRLRSTRATVVAEGAGDSLLPLLWAAQADGAGLRPGVAQTAAIPARRLSAAASRRDAAAVARAARGLAGLGPGLTPSGDDLLAGFAAAWCLVGESLGVDAVARQHVTAALFAGAERGASPLGRAWLEHACGGELPEPMTRFVATLLALEPRGLDMAVRGVLTVGSSSGTDWMVGFLLAATATLDATAPGRPW
jgi:hypothetical protein